MWKCRVLLMSNLFTRKNTHTIHWHFINLCTVILFNITQDSDVVWLYKVDGNTFATKSTRSANPIIEISDISQPKLDKRWKVLLYWLLYNKVKEVCGMRLSINNSTHTDWLRDQGVFVWGFLNCCDITIFFCAHKNHKKNQYFEKCFAFTTQLVCFFLGQLNLKKCKIMLY